MENVHASMNIFGFCECQLACIVRLSTGRGYFGADDINRFRGTGRHFAMGVFCHLTQESGSRGNGLLWKCRRGIISARHTRIEMDLFVTGAHTISKQVTRFLQCHRGSFIPPREWSKMIAPEQNVLCREPGSRHGGVNPVRELSGRQVRVSAELVYLA